MGTRMHEFMFSQSRRALHASRRWPDQNRVEFFLNEVENDLSRWLKLWSTDRPERHPSQMAKVSIAADRLLAALLGLDDGARQKLFYHLLTGGVCGCNYREVSQLSDRFLQDIADLADCASSLAETPRKSIESERAQDLCERLVISHVLAFAKAPGYGSENLFKAFLDELKNDLPGAIPTIGRAMIEKAISRSSGRLEDVQARLKPLK